MSDMYSCLRYLYLIQLQVRKARGHKCILKEVFMNVVRLLYVSVTYDIMIRITYEILYEKKE